MRCHTCSTCLDDLGIETVTTSKDGKNYICPNGHKVFIHPMVTPEMCYRVLIKDPSRWTESDRRFVVAYEDAAKRLGERLPLTGTA